MQFFVLSALLIGLVGFHFGDSSFLGDRLGLKEGNNNSILRKSKGCNLLCSLKTINFKNKNGQGQQQQTCYKLSGKNNATVSECVYSCLKLKGEKLENATQCTCQNGVCIAVAPASASSTTTNGTFITETTETEGEETFSSSSPSPTSSSSVSSSTSTPVSTTTTPARP